MNAPVLTLLFPLLASSLAAQSAPARQDPPAPVPRTDVERAKPGGGTFYRDPHQGGAAARLGLAELAWGRLVDVHDVDASGTPGPLPVHAGTVVRADVGSDGEDYRLETDPLGGTVRLVVLRTAGAPEPWPGAGTFTELFLGAARGLTPIEGEHGGALVPRNAAIVARFDDLLDDGPAARQALGESVRLFVGLPPREPFQARVVFDETFGGLAQGRFHATRVILDLTVSDGEAAAGSPVLAVNELGLPASPVGREDANVLLVIPTRVQPGAGQFRVLTNLAGAGLLPGDPLSRTQDLVRALRSGNETQPGRGFLTDEVPPQVIAGWEARIDAAEHLPGGLPGSDFLVDLAFLSTCRQDPAPRDLVRIGARVLRVIAAGMPLQPDGTVRDLALRLVGDPLERPRLLLGPAVFETPLSLTGALPAACWVDFQPEGARPPASGIDPAVTVRVRFSEPMEPTTFRAFDTFRLLRGPLAAPSPTTLVVGEVLAGPDLRDHAFVPVLPLAHRAGAADEYHVLLEGGPAGVTDLAGNPLALPLPPVRFTLDPAAPEERNGGIVLRFTTPDEFQVGQAAGAPDVRGQFLHDLALGQLRGRPVTRYAVPIDATQPVRSLMVPFLPGVQTPLSPLGSKLQATWRYCDAGWLVTDETQHNVDVEGLSWSPAGGAVIADFFPGFEILLAHGAQVADEYVSQILLPQYPASGLASSPAPFAGNVLQDPLSPQTLVHPRVLGYSVNPADLYLSSTGTPLMPFPLNRGTGSYLTYTWRDTAVLAEGGEDGAGVPLAIEANPPLQLYGNQPPGFVAPEGEVPSIGLPLLMEFRCYPAPTAIGLNALDVSLAINSSARPNFRAFSTGGVTGGGIVVPKDPDDETFPTGGFGPNGFLSEPTDNVSYTGELGLVVRVSRAHTIWLDTGAAAPDFVRAIVEAPVGAPAGSPFLVADFRGADGFVGGLGGEPFDASQLDPYGDPPRATTVLHHGGDPSWSSSVDAADGARYLQARISFVNDVQAGTSPAIDSLAVAFLE